MLKKVGEWICIQKTKVATNIGFYIELVVFTFLKRSWLALYLPCSVGISMRHGLSHSWIARISADGENVAVRCWERSPRELFRGTQSLCLRIVRDEVSRRYQISTNKWRVQRGHPDHRHQCGAQLLQHLRVVVHWRTRCELQGMGCSETKFVSTGINAVRQQAVVSSCNHFLMWGWTELFRSVTQKNPNANLEPFLQSSVLLSSRVRGEC